ncbi:MAG: DUF1854 domain-containing protein [Oscillospiraceae bacterium]|jgi:hypothetical protein|nr:DUF1854 domain-containing protein [Oscillospiraceae bacterium]
MPRYIYDHEVTITDNDGIFVDVEFLETREALRELEPRRLFPITGLDGFITLLDSEGSEQAIIRNIYDLPDAAREVIERSLEEYYMIPRIQRFVKMAENFDIWMWTVETDRGVYTFEIRNHNTAIKPLFDGRVLIKDANDNRYEIPDVRQLDKQSQRMILPNL